MRDTGPARFFVPVGIILIVVGNILLGFNTDKYVETSGVISSVTAAATAEDEGGDVKVGGFPAPVLIGVGVKEIYFRFDGNSLKPGYIVEDGGRNVLLEGKMTKQTIVE